MREDGMQVSGTTNVNTYSTSPNNFDDEEKKTKWSPFGIFADAANFVQNLVAPQTNTNNESGSSCSFISWFTL